jgi:hypothetical protein
MKREPLFVAIKPILLALVSARIVRLIKVHPLAWIAEFENSAHAPRALVGFPQ